MDERSKRNFEVIRDRLQAHDKSLSEKGQTIQRLEQEIAMLKQAVDDLRRQAMVGRPLGGGIGPTA